MQLKQSMETYMFLSQVRSSPHIMELKGSPACSQQPPLVPILSQINPVRHPLYLFDIYFNIILPQEMR